MRFPWPCGCAVKRKRSEERGVEDWTAQGRVCGRSGDKCGSALTVPLAAKEGLPSRACADRNTFTPITKCESPPANENTSSLAMLTFSGRNGCSASAFCRARLLHLDCLL
jgi:hypothetical protein